MVGNVVAFIINIFRFHKLKIFTFVMAVFAFTVLIFPYDDLSDLVTTKVGQMTQNQVFLQFEKLGMSFIPTPSLDFSNVNLETPMLPSLKAESLSIAPSIASLLAFTPGFTVDADGFLKGHASLTYKVGKKTPAGERIQSVNMTLKNLDLSKLRETLDLQINMSGDLKGDLAANVDPSLVVPPDGQVEIEIDNFKMPSNTISFQMDPSMPPMPFTLPPLTLQKIIVRGQLANNELQVEEIQLGKGNEAISGKAKGRMNITFVRSGMGVVPRFGAYDLSFSLEAKNSAAADFRLFLSFLDKFKSPTKDGYRYLFRLAGSSFYGIPNPSPLSQF